MVQFELPSDWVVVDAVGRTRMDAYVLQFAPKAESSLGFAAESPDQRVSVNVRLLPTGSNSQSQLLQLEPSDLAQGRTMLEESLRQNLGNAGMSLLGLGSLSVSQVGDLQALYTMARRTHPSSAEPWTLEQFQVWDGPSSFTLTVSYAASAEATASRVIQRIRQTAR